VLSGSARWVDAEITRLLHFWPIISVHRPFADRRGKDWLMSQNFYRLPDAQLATASTSFFKQINADPAVHGLSVENAADYGVLNSAYQAALSLAMDESTRTRVTVSSKNAARAALCDLAKVLGSSIRNTASVTNAQLLGLGLLPRAGRSVVERPTVAPVVDCVAVIGRTVKVRLRVMNANRRGKPEGVALATIFSCVGDQPASDIANWKYEGVTSKVVMDVTFPDSVAGGSQVWITATWANSRGQAGPMANPAATYVAGGGVSARAA
jgi:hypothetical protein